MSIVLAAVQDTWEKGRGTRVAENKAGMVAPGELIICYAKKFGIYFKILNIQ